VVVAETGEAVDVVEAVEVAEVQAVGFERSD
jgi:hypothetical protein